MSKRKLNGFEKRELIGKSYWEDPRWKKVRKLRKENKHGEANNIVFKIRASWGLE